MVAKVVATFKIMPESPDVSLEALDEHLSAVFSKYGKIYKQRIQPVAFGLNALVYEFIMEEKEGGTEPVEAELREVPDVSDVQVTDVTRMFEGI
jgi:elongation factor 1-beta